MSSLHLTPGKRPLPKLGSLEVGRALAAMAVVAHHAGQASDAFTTQKFGNRFEVGALGVDFFFILSGFIIYHVHGRDARTWEAARKFVEKRLRRIYVPYLPVTIALIAAYTLFPELSHAGRDWSILTSLTLIPTGSPPALSVAWTLSFEIMFYCFFLILFCTRYFWICVLAWTAAVVTVAWVGLADRLAPPTLQAFLDPIVLEFIAGMGAALLFSHLRPSSWPIPMFIGICLTGIFFGGWQLTSDMARARIGSARSWNSVGGGAVPLSPAASRHAARDGIIFCLSDPQSPPIHCGQSVPRCQLLAPHFLGELLSCDKRRHLLPPPVRSADLAGAIAIWRTREQNQNE